MNKFWLAIVGVVAASGLFSTAKASVVTQPINPENERSDSEKESEVLAELEARLNSDEFQSEYGNLVGADHRGADAKGIGSK
jgi:hypothetical protein